MEKPGILSTSGISMFIVFMTIIVFFQTQAHEFVTIGDSELIYNNPHIKKGFDNESLKWAFSPARDEVRMPLTQLSFILDYKFHRLNPTWYHLENVLIHILNSLLLFLILKRATLKVLRSAFAAALFALHPINVGAVAWAAGRKDILSAFFFLFSTTAYMYYLKKPVKFNYICLMVVFIFAVFTYPLAAVLPAALLLFDWWPLRRLETVKYHALIKEKIPLFIISGIIGIDSLISFFSRSYLTPEGSLSFISRIGNVPVSYISYLGRFLIPVNFSALYPYPALSFDIWKGVAALVILSVITYIVMKIAHKFKFMTFGWMWFIVLLLPVSGLFNQGFEAMADRYVYIPSIGLIVLAAWGIPELFEKFFANLKYKYLNTFCIGLLIVLALLARMEVSNWKTGITLYEHAARSVQNNYLAYNGLGEAMEDKGSLSDAVKFYKKAMAANPYYDRSYNNLGKALLKLGKKADALEIFDKALKTNPNSPVANYYIGSIMLGEGRLDQAEIYFKHALDVRPDYLDAMTGLGIIEVNKNNTEGALEYFRKVVNTDPQNAGGFKQIGLIYFKQNNPDSAEINFRKALALNPRDAETHFKLGELLDQKGNKPEARRHYLEALRINPEYRSAVEKFYE